MELSVPLTKNTSGFILCNRDRAKRKRTCFSVVLAKRSGCRLDVRLLKIGSGWHGLGFTIENIPSAEKYQTPNKLFCIQVKAAVTATEEMLDYFLVDPELIFKLRQ